MSLVENGKLSCGHDCGELDEYCHACVQEIYAKARELYDRHPDLAIARGDIPLPSIDEMRAAAGVVEMRLPKMMLGAGQYSVAVQIAAEGYIEQDSRKFFSIDPDVYHCIMYALDFTVLDAGWIGDGTIFEGEGDWTMTPATAN